MTATRTRMERAQGYDPEPMDVPPLFQSPPRPVAMSVWFVTKFLWPQALLWLLVSLSMLPWLAGWADGLRDMWRFVAR